MRPRKRAASAVGAPVAAHPTVQSIGTMITSLAAIGALVFTGLSLNATREQVAAAHRQNDVAQQGQFTERYTKAVEQLDQRGPEHMQTRLGGIYALQRLMVDSPRDQRTIVNVFITFITSTVERIPPQAPPIPPLVMEGEPPVTVVPPAPEPARSCPDRIAPDIAAAFTALTDRDRTLDEGPDDGLTLDWSCLKYGGLDHAHLAKAQLQDAYLHRAKLSEANLSKASLTWADLSDADLSGADLGEAHLGGANLDFARLGRANLSSAILTQAILHGANLDDANLASAKLEVARLDQASLRNTNLEDADLSGVVLNAADLTSANLTDADLSCTESPPVTPEQNGIILEPSCAYLQGANLAGADLRGADLSGARMMCIDLQGQTPTAPYTRCTDLRNADLTGADLTGVDLRGADLRGARHEGAIVTGAVTDPATQGKWW